MMKIQWPLSQNPKVMSGAIVFDGTRVPLTHLFDYLESDAVIEDFLSGFPSVSKAQVDAVLDQLKITVSNSGNENPCEDTTGRVGTNLVG